MSELERKWELPYKNTIHDLFQLKSITKKHKSFFSTKILVTIIFLREYIKPKSLSLISITSYLYFSIFDETIIILFIFKPSIKYPNQLKQQTLHRHELGTEREGERTSQKTFLFDFSLLEIRIMKSHFHSYPFKDNYIET